MSGAPGGTPERSVEERVPRLGLVAGRIAGWSARNPRRVLAGAVVVFLLSLLSLSRLHVSSSLAVMLGTHSAAAAAMERVTTEYRAGDALVLLVELPPEREADEAGHAELIAFAMRLESSLRADPAVASLISQIRFREDPAILRFARDVMLPAGVFYLSDDGAARLAARLTPESIHEQIARNEAMIAAPGPAGVALSDGVLQDPLRLMELIPPELRRGQSLSGAEGSEALGRPDLSQDQRALLVHIGAAGLGNDYDAASRLVDAVVRCSARVNTANLRIEPAGPAAIARESSRVIRRDSVISCLVSVGLLYGLFLVFYRRWAAGLVIGGVATVGMAAGVAVLALFITRVSPLAAMIAALLAGLGTDYGIHFLSHYDGFRARGMGSEAAAVQTAQHMAVPIVTNCFTSIVGFISLWPSKIQMLSDFAVMGTAGLIGALLAVFVLMPAALAAVDRRVGARPAERAMFGTLADVVAARPRMWMRSSLAVLGIAVAAAALQGFALRFETNLTVMHPRPSRALNATNEVIQEFSQQGDLVPVEVSVSSPDALAQAAHDAALALSSERCRAVGVTAVLGLHSLIPNPRSVEARRGALAEIDAEHVVSSFDAAIDGSAFDPAAYAEYRNFLRTLVSAPRAPTIADVLQHPEVAAQIFPSSHTLAHTPPTRTLLMVRLVAPLHDRTQRRTTVEALNAAAASVTSGKVTVAGLAAVSEELEESTREGLPQSVAISIVLVLLWLTLVFRRPLDVLLALVPLVFAAGATVLFIIATGQRFNPINSVAIPLLDGIAVDAGVFLVSVYRTHGSSREKLRVHLRSTTHAVLLSVATTMTAFAALCFTRTPAVQSLGLVSAIGIAASGIGALLLLMPILIRRAPEQKAL